MTVHGIIVAAGTGSRLGGPIPKQLADLRGLPVLAWSLRAFVGAGVGSLVVVANAHHREATAAAARAVTADAALVTGGATRTGSVRSGLRSLDARGDDIVLVHDAARPLVSAQLVTSVIDSARTSGAATAAVPASDTLVHVSERLIERTLDRSTTHHVQTPQGFTMRLLVEAHERAEAAGDDDATDDAGLVARHLGIGVAIVRGEDTNLKITTPADLVVAGALLDARSEEA
jgi:2-C-methyl-D-erythritol 4-phosphate cytidylyltransferase